MGIGSFKSKFLVHDRGRHLHLQQLCHGRRATMFSKNMLNCSKWIKYLHISKWICTYTDLFWIPIDFLVEITVILCPLSYH